MARVSTRRAARGIRASAGLEAVYRQRLTALVDEMHRSIVYWLTARWRDHPVLAQDESPVAGLRRQMRRMRRQWEDRFDEAAPQLAEYFAKSVNQRTTQELSKILKDAGFSVEFGMTRQTQMMLSAVTTENVGLIKSIPAQHLDAVEGAVMRSVQAGRDLGSLTKELQERHQVTKDRAALIARDQNNKATAVITRERQVQAGITRAIWMHSHAGKKPRPSHVAFDGKEYDVATGAMIDGELIWPGVLVNCRCFARPIIPGLSRRG